MSPPVYTSRFDDFSSPTAVGFELAGLAGVVEAASSAEVRPALARVEAAVANGLWAAGFVAYEAATGLDPGLTVRRRQVGEPFADLPLLAFGLFTERRPARAIEAGDHRLGPWRPSVSRTRYAAGVATIAERIAAGDTYQVNHTFRLRAPFAGDPRGLYRDLGLAQAGRYAGHLDFGRHQVLCASPELFFEVEGERLITRPMKGTAARGRWSGEDRAAAARLAASPKEQAENVMIVDLLRNDLGRLAAPGTVGVDDLFVAERYPTVWQLTSGVSCRLADPATPLADLFAALFPCGSVTGAPKRSTMGIIADLEDSPRGVYTGAVGWLAPPGTAGPRARFAVAIRTVTIDTVTIDTVTIDRETGLAEYGVGGGVTAGSTADGEYREALLKAQVLTHHRPAFDLLETLRWEPDGGFPFLDRHLDRLAASADYFGFRCDRGQVEEALETAVVEAAADGGEGAAPLRFRLTLSPSGEPSVTVAPLPAEPARPLRLAIDREPVDPEDPLLFHKTTLRDPYESRRQRWPGHDDVLLVNDRGEVCEATIANLAVQLGGRWWTPPLASGCLPGVYRAELLARGELAERPITVAELADAEGLALLNAVRLWRPAELAGPIG